MRYVYCRSQVASSNEKAMWCVCLLLLGMSVIFGENQEEFSMLALEHKRTCYTHATCRILGNSSQSPCCGTCSCDSKCAKYGTCCLGMYHSFNHARESTQNNRYVGS